MLRQARAHVIVTAYAFELNFEAKFIKQKEKT